MIGFRRVPLDGDPGADLRPAAELTISKLVCECHGIFQKEDLLCSMAGNREVWAASYIHLVKLTYIHFYMYIKVCIYPLLCNYNTN